VDLVALISGDVHIDEHVCVVPLGIGIDGTKHPLGLAKGSAAIAQTEALVANTGDRCELQE